MLNKKTKTFIGPVDVNEARGYTTDIIVFERHMKFPDDVDDFVIFRECTLHTSNPLFAVSLKEEG